MATSLRGCQFSGWFPLSINPSANIHGQPPFQKHHADTQFIRMHHFIYPSKYNLFLVEDAMSALSEERPSAMLQAFIVCSTMFIRPLYLKRPQT